MQRDHVGSYPSHHINPPWLYPSFCAWVRYTHFIPFSTLTQMTICRKLPPSNRFEVIISEGGLIFLWFSCWEVGKMGRERRQNWRQCSRFKVSGNRAEDARRSESLEHLCGGFNCGYRANIFSLPPFSSSIS
jgi:hypothetical protein